jgi:hypothetical protein
VINKGFTIYKLTSLFQIIVYFSFSKYIVFPMYLDIRTLISRPYPPRPANHLFVIYHFIMIVVDLLLDIYIYISSSTVITTIRTDKT